MAWKRYFTAVTAGTNSPLTNNGGNLSNPSRTNYSSYLPDVYSGHPNRLERYAQYDTMDLDPEVNAAFDILAEFCTQVNEENGTAFEIFFKEPATSTEIKIVKKYLQQWCKQNQFGTRMFKIIRNTFKYGDCFFIRDPETLSWFYVDPNKVDKIIVNESEGKKPEQYVIRDMNVNFQTLTVTQINPSNQNTTPGGTAYVTGGAMQRGMVGAYPQGSGSRFSVNQNQWAIDAQHVIHLSLSEGLDNNFPFGNSLMETIFKVYKQKELLEDAIIIYRVQRAPERRAFYIDVGNMPSHLAMSFVERVKNEINQRRIPSLTGGGQSAMDSGFNPLAINEDYFFPQTCSTLDTKIKLLDGRDLELKDIIQEYEQGKENWVYAVNQKTHIIEPGKIAWAGKTRLNAQIVEVLLDNGEKVRVTPDHRFIMRDGNEVEAQNLVSGDSLMPLYLHDAKTEKHQHAGKYLRYTCNATGKKKWVHTMVCPKKISSRETEIHHIDFNSLNNNPTNLIEMNTQAHRELHKESGTYYMSQAWVDPIKREKILSGIRTYHSNAAVTDKEMFKERGRINGANTWKNQRSSARVLASLSKTRGIVSKKRTVIYSDRMCTRLLELYNQGFDSISKLYVLRSDEEFQDAFREANPTLLRDKNRPLALQVTDTNLNKMAVHMRYSGWKNFKESYSVNHKVISVSWIETREDTGDITVESASGAHNFALSAGVFIHNSEGRGSKIDVLPGGSNLGEIDDLLFFTQKMMRALRIPSSYLPTGMDDSQAVFNDGKVGTAYIQELRFNNYCERLQSLVNHIFDSEFKLYLREKGMNIDSNLFDIMFNPPQNFAAYRQAEMDGARISTFGSISTIPFLSKRFALKRFLGLSAEEIAENEMLWQEENGGTVKQPSAQSDLRSAGVTPGGLASDFSDLGSSDLGLDELPPEDTGMPEPGAAPGGLPPPQ